MYIRYYANSRKCPYKTRDSQGASFIIELTWQNASISVKVKMGILESKENLQLWSGLTLAPLVKTKKNKNKKNYLILI